MKNLKTEWLLYFAFLLFAFTACQDNNKRQNETEVDDIQDTEMTEERRENNTVTGRIQDDRELSTFSGGMTRADLSDDFTEGEGPFTIFAPSNDAYDELSAEERDQLENSENIRQVGASTNYLIVERRLPEDSLRQSIHNVGGNLELITLQGEQLMATIEGDSIVLRDGRGNSATIIETDRNASNGVVHVIDRVLRPKDIDRNDAADLMGIEVDENNRTNETGRNTNTGNNQ